MKNTIAKLLKNTLSVDNFIYSASLQKPIVFLIIEIKW